jgi:peptidoglycan hydrolase CwlO-like protein
LRARQEAEKVIKNLELQLNELQTKADEQSRLLNDFAALKSRLQNENSDLEHQVCA